MDDHADRIRRRTASSVLARIDDDTFDRLAGTVEGTETLAARLQALDREWDTDRVIETEASIVALAALALGTTFDRRLLAVPAAVAAMLLLHAATGRYPLLPLLRRLGVRSAREIERERYAAKALHGHFDARIETQR